MIPDDTWSCRTAPKPFVFNNLSFPAERPSGLFDLKVGPEELSNSARRNDVAAWMATYEDGAFYVRKAVNGAWRAREFQFNSAEVPSSLSLSFDSLGRPTIFYAVGTVLKLWYHNSQLNGRDILTVTTNGAYPHADFDSRSDTSDASSDIQLFYVRNDALYNRLQRDNYAYEYHTGVVEPGLKIVGIGRNSLNEFQVEYSYRGRRSGINTYRRVLDCNSSFLSDMKGAEFEVEFTVLKAPSKCEMERIYEEHNWVRSVLVQHSGTASQGALERLFSLEFYPSFLGSQGKLANMEILLVLYGGPAYTDTYFVEYISAETVLLPGVHTLRFTQAAPLNGNPMKRIEYIKDGVTYVDVIVADVHSIKDVIPSVFDGLRFGAFRDRNAVTCYYPAIYGDIAVTVNGQLTEFHKKFGDKIVQSVPSGKTLRLYQDGDAGLTFG